MYFRKLYSYLHMFIWVYIKYIWGFVIHARGVTETLLWHEGKHAEQLTALNDCNRTHKLNYIPSNVCVYINKKVSNIQKFIYISGALTDVSTYRPINNLVTQNTPLKPRHIAHVCYCPSAAMPHINVNTRSLCNRILHALTYIQTSWQRFYRRLCEGMCACMYACRNNT